MYSVTATLRMSSGEEITAHASAPSPEAEVIIEYGGAVHLLPRHPVTGGPNDLRLLFHRLAGELNGTASFMESGHYERWAE